VKPPLPPDLDVLGDRLEQAAARALLRRRVRRRQVVNALASLAIAVPLTASMLTSNFAREPVASRAAPAAFEPRSVNMRDEIPLPRASRPRPQPTPVLPQSLRPGMR
jgi:hypothetical protein